MILWKAVSPSWWGIFSFFERFPDFPLSKAFNISTLGARKFLLDKAVNLAGFFTDGAMDELRH